MIDETGVLADPAESCVGGQFFFHDGCGIDADACFCVGCDLPQPISQDVQSLGDDEVIVLAQGIACDSAVVFAVDGWKLSQWDVIVQGYADDGGGSGEISGGVGAMVEAIMEPVHGSGLACVQPLTEILTILRGLGRCDADEVKAQVSGVTFDIGGQCDVRMIEGHSGTLYVGGGGVYAGWNEIA